jgi:hypothetical protein
MLERAEETTDPAGADATAPPGSQRGHPIRVVIAGLGHPLSLLILGSLLTYVIAPIILDRINERRLRYEAKQRKALEVWQHNTEFNSKLNALKTMLESYHNQNVRFQLAPADLNEAQKEFRQDFTKRYLELDEMAWWWYRDLQREMNILNLVPKDQLPRLNADLDKYGANVNESVGLLKPLWQTITSREYQPNDEKTKAKFEQLRQTAEHDLPRLFNERSELIQDVTQIINEPE